MSGHLRAFDLEDFDFKSKDGFYKMWCMGQMGAPQVAEHDGDLVGAVAQQVSQANEDATTETGGAA